MSNFRTQLLVAFLLVFSPVPPAQADKFGSLIGTVVKGCKHMVAQHAGYYGIGPMAFHEQDPRWADLDPELVELARRFTTLGADEFPEFADLVPMLATYSPYTTHVQVETMSHSCGEQSVIYSGVTIQSSRHIIRASYGVGIGTSLHFRSWGRLSSSAIHFHLGNEPERTAFAAIYAHWVQHMSPTEMSRNLPYYLADPDQGQLAISINSDEDLKRWLSRMGDEIETRNPELHEAVTLVLFLAHHGQEAVDWDEVAEMKRLPELYRKHLIRMHAHLIHSRKLQANPLASF